jgi:hypothetical protein
MHILFNIYLKLSPLIRNYLVGQERSLMGNYVTKQEGSLIRNYFTEQEMYKFHYLRPNCLM